MISMIVLGHSGDNLEGGGAVVLDCSARKDCSSWIGLVFVIWNSRKKY